MTFPLTPHTNVITGPLWLQRLANYPFFGQSIASHFFFDVTQCGYSGAEPDTKATCVKLPQHHKKQEKTATQHSSFIFLCPPQNFKLFPYLDPKSSVFMSF